MNEKEGKCIKKRQNSRKRVSEWARLKKKRNKTKANIEKRRSLFRTLK